MQSKQRLRKTAGWFLAIAAVAGMLLGNFSFSTPLAGILFDLGAMLLLGVGMVLIVA
jgi:hypothetical protein